MIHIFGTNEKKSGFELKTGVFQAENFYSECILLHLLHGKLTVKTTKDLFSLRNQQLLILKNNQHIEIVSDADSTYLIVYYFTPSLLNAFSRHQQQTFQTLLIDCDEQVGKELLHHTNRIIQYIDQVEGKVDFHLVSLSMELLHLLTLNYAAKKKVKRNIENRTLEIILYIEENYRQPISLEEIASFFGVSPAYFSRYFKQQTGTGFLDYLTNYRLEIVAQRISASDDKIALISSEEGFTNLNSFNKKFKEKYAMTPREYREQNRKISEEGIASASSDWQRLPEQMNRIGLESIDLKQNTGVQNDHPWSKLLNIGSAQDLLGHDLRRHVTLLKNGLNLEYLRFWNLFTKSMNFDPSITAKYNFEKVDSVLDFVLEQGLKPFIELSYKIKRIHRSTREVLVFDKDDFAFPLNSKEWADVLEQFMRHVTGRYGRQKVKEWRFEVSFAYSDRNELDELIDHYKLTYETIRKYTQAKIGGPGGKVQSIGDYDYTKDLAYMHKRNVCFDFISYMLYPYHEDEKGEIASHRDRDADFLAHKTAQIIEAIKAADYADCSVYITEWSNSISNRNIFNDSLYKGTYIIKNISSIIGMVEGIGYWVGSDFIGEFIDSRDVLHGGAGLIAKGSIRKPAFLAFHFLQFLKEKILYIGKNLIAATDEEGENFSLLAFNYQEPGTSYYLTKEDEIKISELSNHFLSKTEVPLEISLPAEAAAKYEMKVFRVNETFGNIIARWQDISYRSSLAEKDLEYLRKGSQPKVNYFQLTSTEEGTLDIRDKLSPYEFVYMSIKKIQE